MHIMRTVIGIILKIILGAIVLCVLAQVFTLTIP